jgi:hypothetical protein
MSRRDRRTKPRQGVLVGQRRAAPLIGVIVCAHAYARHDTPDMGSGLRCPTNPTARLSSGGRAVMQKAAGPRPPAGIKAHADTVFAEKLEQLLAVVPHGMRPAWRRYFETLFMEASYVAD